MVRRGGIRTLKEASSGTFHRALTRPYAKVLRLPIPPRARGNKNPPGVGHHARGARHAVSPERPPSEGGSSPPNVGTLIFAPGPRVVCPTSDSWRIKFAFNQPWRPRLGERPRVRSISRSRTSITRALKPARRR